MIGRISLSTWCFEQYVLRDGASLDDVLRMAADMGVDGIDLLDSQIGFGPRPSLHELNRLRRRIESYGLDLVSMWFHTDMIARSAIDSPEAAVADLSEYLAVAAQLGASYVAVQAGTLPPGTSLESGRRTVVDVLSAVEPIAREYGVPIGTESSRPYSVAPLKSPELAREVVQEVGSEYVIVIPDFEAWRLPSSIPRTYLEVEGAPEPIPTTLEEFQKCLPFAPNIQAKFLEIGDDGLDPNYPEESFLTLLSESPVTHDLTVEYEGWIPGVHPERDPLEAVRAILPRVRASRGE